MKIICFGKKEDNLNVSIRTGLIGSKKSYFLGYFKPEDRVLLYANGQIFARAAIDGSGFADSSPVWSDYEYPYRFKIKNIVELKTPFSFLGSEAHAEIKRTFGNGWGYKFLFSPKELPLDVISLLPDELS